MSEAQGNGERPEAEPGRASPSTAKKPYRQILFEEISEGRHELERPPFGLFMSGISAGLDIGFSVFVVAALQTTFAGEWPPSLLRLLSANGYAVGFLFVVVGRSELFTEHTSLAVLPLLSGQSRIGSLARLWAIVYVSNLIGTMGFAALMAKTGPMIGVIEPEVLQQLARRTYADAPMAMVLSAILAAWLMGLLSWLVTASRDTISQIVIVWIVGAVIGFLGLHHAIVGSVAALAGIFVGGTTWANYGYFLLWTTLGNAIGGVVFVALLKYGHASRGIEGEQVEAESEPG